MLKNLLSLGVLFTASTAYASGGSIAVKTACDPSNRNSTSPGNLACTCMFLAAQDIKATSTGGDYTTATYASWHATSSVTWGNGSETWGNTTLPPDAGETQSADIIAGSCFDLMANVNPADVKIREIVTNKLEIIAVDYANDDGPAVLYYEAVSSSTGGGYTDWIDSEFGSWSESTSTGGGTVFEPALVLEHDPAHTEIFDTSGNSLGVVESLTTPLIAAFLEDSDLDGDYEADLWFEDGSNATADNLGPGTFHIHQ